MNSNPAEVGLTRGPIYSFVPAHGGCRAGAVAEQICRALAEVPGFPVLLAGFSIQNYLLWNPADSPRRLDGQTWGAFVFDSHGLEILDAGEVYPRQLPRVLDYARRSYRTVCFDLSNAKEVQATETLRASECVFIVSYSDVRSLQMARDKKDWLKAIGIADQCGLLLERVPGGVISEQAEEITGLPVCSLVDRQEHIERFAGWLASEEVYASEALCVAVQ
ncbi:MAG TPA: hypothetical protein VMT15_01345 [Bryobacteraceae bacterium]|nr:hypothetical protein [Bryobacteraceae bacterium]